MDVLELVLDGAHRDKRSRPGDKQLLHTIETEIEMPGIPEDAVVLQLYMMGIMAYDTVCSVMGGKHGLAKSSFNAKPTIDVKMLNGIKPDPPKAPGGSSARSAH